MKYAVILRCHPIGLLFVKQVFEGNKDATSIVKQEFPAPVRAQYIRIYPVSYEEWPCLRVELYGKGNLGLTFIASYMEKPEANAVFP